MKRTLRLRTERLSELSENDLRAVEGGIAKTLDCVNPPRPSNYVISLCGCLTSYCSIDVC